MIGKLFAIGICILVGAIIINVFASLLNIPSWYGVMTGSKIAWYFWIYLVIVYPFLLGVIAYYSMKLIPL